MHEMRRFCNVWHIAGEVGAILPYGCPCVWEVRNWKTRFWIEIFFLPSLNVIIIVVNLRMAFCWMLEEDIATFGKWPWGLSPAICWPFCFCFWEVRVWKVCRSSMQWYLLHVNSDSRTWTDELCNSQLLIGWDYTRSNSGAKNFCFDEEKFCPFQPLRRPNLWLGYRGITFHILQYEVFGLTSWGCNSNW